MTSFPINPIDVGVAFVLLISVGLAFFRGFIHELFSIVAWVGAAAAVVFGLPQVRPFASQYLQPDWLADAVAGFALFLIALVVLSVITRWVTKSVRGSVFGPLDRVIGVLFGVVRGMVVVSLVYMVVSWILPPQDHPDLLTQARTRPLMADGAEMITSLLPEDLSLTPGEAKDVANTAREAGVAAGVAAVTAGDEVGDTFDQLADPAPAPEEGADDADDPTGYTDEETGGLDALLESTIGVPAPRHKPTP